MYSVALLVAVLVLAAVVVAALSAVSGRRRDREALDAAIQLFPTSHRAAGRAAHGRPGWQLAPAPARRLAPVRYLPGTVADTGVFPAVAPLPGGDAA